MKNFALEMRPQSLDSVIGQQAVISALKNHLKSGSISIGYLFSGPTGTGKTTLANILAKELKSKEIITINAADQNGVDFVRQLAEKTDYMPFEGTFRVIILEEAQQLTSQAQSCLLPLLENKDSSTIFMFTTTDLQKILKPLIDRCLTFHLKEFSDDEIKRLVKQAIMWYNMPHE